MATVVKTRIVRIGKWQGVRISKVLLEQANLGEEVELVVEADRIVIRSRLPVRVGWEKRFQRMAEVEDDMLLDLDVTGTGWDEEAWEW